MKRHYYKDGTSQLTTKNGSVVVNVINVQRERLAKKRKKVK